MPQDDIRTLKRKVDSIITNIKIYERDIKKATKKLKENYNISDIKDIDEILDNLNDKVKIMQRAKDKLLRKANNLLKGITTNDDEY
jgi:mRNA-degrading endonuclease YafQ of YafQ-DinJ toxin-antitoxin module